MKKVLTSFVTGKIKIQPQWDALSEKWRWNTFNSLSYLTVCPSKPFYTFQCGQNGKEHSDPVEIPLAQHFWNNEALWRKIMNYNATRLKIT